MRGHAAPCTRSGVTARLAPALILVLAWAASPAHAQQNVRGIDITATAGEQFTLAVAAFPLGLSDRSCPVPAIVVYAPPITSWRKLRAFGFVACQTRTSSGRCFVTTLIEPSRSNVHRSSGRGRPLTTDA